jgi:hypothetical protein
LRRPSDLDPDEHEKLAGIRSRCSHLDSLVAHVKGFAEMLTQRTGENLENARWKPTIGPSCIPSPSASAEPNPPSPPGSPCRTAPAK